jgi:drug/metabolite transporter (DMT)-like permease
MTFAHGRILGLMLIAVAALAVGEVMLSKGARQAGREGEGWIAQAIALASNAWVLTGCFLLIVHVGLYMLALREADLSFVLPLTAASYPLATLLAQFVLHEHVGVLRWAGTLMITIGVAIIALGDASIKH